MKQLSEIGQVKQTFAPSMLNMLAGVIIGGLMIWGANTSWAKARFDFRTTQHLRWYREKGASWASVIMLCVVAVLLVVGGLALIYWMWRQRSLRVHFGEDGFLQESSKESRLFLWDDIIQVDEIHTLEAPPLLSGGLRNLLPKVKSISYMVYRKDDEIPFIADGNTIKHHKKFGGMLKAILSERDVEWRLLEPGK